MIKSCFKQLYYKGWLKSKDSIWKDSDRFVAGQKLYLSYEKSHNFSIGVLDLTRAYVDGSLRYNATIFGLDSKEDFLRAYAAIPLNARGLVEKIILKNMLPKNAEKNKTKIKETLCFALDCLICHYMGK